MRTLRRRLTTRCVHMVLYQSTFTAKRTMKQRSYRFLLFLTLAVFTLQACAEGTIGTGVILWSTDELRMQPGELVDILEENTNTETYLIRTPDDDEPQTVPTYRIASFETEEEARAFAEEFEDMAHLYARSRRRALPVRNRPDTDSRTVYRLQEDEVMKVLEIEEEEVTVSGLTGQWHRVLTTGGTEGWAFGYSLRVYDLREGEIIGEEDEELPRLGREIVENTWHPHDYHELVTDGTPVLEELNPEYGLFPDHEERLVRVSKDSVEEEWSYTGITASGSDHVRFQGTPLEIRRDGTNRMTAFFEVDGEEYTMRLRSLPEDIEDIIEAEEERREQALEEFHRESTLMASAVYGVLQVDESGSFIWEDTDELRGRAIPIHYGNSGELLFKYFPSGDLSARYDGVVSFSFENTPDDEHVSFLYELEPSGVRMTYVPRSQIRDFKVQSDTASSLVMFMTYQQLEDENVEADDLDDEVRDEFEFEEDE